eukprot:Opistho-2@66630
MRASRDLRRRHWMRASRTARTLVTSHRSAASLCLVRAIRATSPTDHSMPATTQTPRTFLRRRLAPFLRTQLMSFQARRRGSSASGRTCAWRSAKAKWMRRKLCARWAAHSHLRSSRRCQGRHWSSPPPSTTFSRQRQTEPRSLLLSAESSTKWRGGRPHSHRSWVLAPGGRALSSPSVLQPLRSLCSHWQSGGWPCPWRPVLSQCVEKNRRRTSRVGGGQVVRRQRLRQHPPPHQRPFCAPPATWMSSCSVDSASSATAATLRFPSRDSGQSILRRTAHPPSHDRTAPLPPTSRMCRRHPSHPRIWRSCKSITATCASFLQSHTRCSVARARPVRLCPLPSSKTRYT